MPIGYQRRSETVVLPSYGMTECMPIISPPQDFELSQRLGTSGVAVGPQLSILDNEGTSLPSGSIDKICVRGPPAFNGYEDPEILAKVIKNAHNTSHIYSYWQE